MSNKSIMKKLIMVIVIIVILIVLMKFASLSQTRPQQNVSVNESVDESVNLSVNESVNESVGKLDGVCLSGGEVYQSPAVLGEILGECCGEMVTIAEFMAPVEGEVECDSVAGSNLICSDCGNGACEDGWENKCNCPEDCP